MHRVYWLAESLKNYDKHSTWRQTGLGASEYSSARADVSLIKMRLLWLMSTKLPALLEQLFLKYPHVIKDGFSAILAVASGKKTEQAI